MSSWQLELRAKAAAPLRTNMVFLENARTHAVAVPAFVAASRDDLVSRRLRVLSPHGTIRATEEWLGTLLRVTPENDAPTRAGAVRTLAACLAGASRDALRGEGERDARRDARDARRVGDVRRGALCGHVRSRRDARSSRRARGKPGTWRARARD